MPIDPATAEQSLRAVSELVLKNLPLAGAIFVGSIGTISYFLTKHSGRRSNEIGSDVRPDYPKRLKEKSGN